MTSLSEEPGEEQEEDEQDPNDAWRTKYVDGDQTLMFLKMVKLEFLKIFFFIYFELISEHDAADLQLCIAFRGWYCDALPYWPLEACQTDLDIYIYIYLCIYIYIYTYIYIYIYIYV